jgi:outer membrane protein OmpA-like peptidoglycan-associated protein
MFIMRSRLTTVAKILYVLLAWAGCWPGGTPRTYAQDFQGLNVGNYAGALSLYEQPASIADSKYKFDILLLGAGVQVGNNYLFLRDPFAPSGTFEETFRQDNRRGYKGLHAALNLYLPTFMVKVGKGWGLGFTSRYRTLASATRIGQPLAQLAINGFDVPELWYQFHTNDGGAITFGNGLELGLALAAPVWKRRTHYLKAGARAAYTLGINGGYIQLPKADYLFYNDHAFSTLDDSEIRVGHASNFEISGDNASAVAIQFQPGFNLGTDLGVVYEWRPAPDSAYTYVMDGQTRLNPEANKYRLRLGVSITDLGWMALSSSLQYHVRTQINDAATQTHYWDTRGVEMGSVQAFDDTLLNRYALIDRKTGTLNLTLPTALNLQADYHLGGPFYLALQTRTFVRLNPRGLTGLDWYSLSPRIDTKHFGLAIPLSMDGFGRFHFGAQLHLGPFMIGTNTLDALLGDVGTAQVNFGIRVPILHRRLRDRDKDQVSDKLDLCPRDPGSPYANGCVDYDRDSIPDNQDECPTKAGPRYLKGCPDLDGDSIPDRLDDCPDQPGPRSLKGCPPPVVLPDTAKPAPADTLALATPKPTPTPTDTLAQPTPVPTTPGIPPTLPQPVSKPGLEPDEIEAMLRRAPQQVFFEFDADRLTDSSRTWLDSLATLLIGLGNRSLIIEGHTDNVGRPGYNLALSQSRAARVRFYLMSKGVSSSRMQAVGYGASRPLKPNDTEAHRLMNRRVEIKLLP